MGFVVSVAKEGSNIAGAGAESLPVEGQGASKGLPYLENSNTGDTICSRHVAARCVPPYNARTGCARLPASARIRSPPSSSSVSRPPRSKPVGISLSSQYFRTSGARVGDTLITDALQGVSRRCAYCQNLWFSGNGGPGVCSASTTGHSIGSSISFRSDDQAL